VRLTDLGRIASECLSVALYPLYSKPSIEQTQILIWEARSAREAEDVGAVTGNRQPEKSNSTEARTHFAVTTTTPWLCAR
jgi:hypothetical protein